MRLRFSLSLNGRFSTFASAPWDCSFISQELPGQASLSWKMLCAHTCLYIKSSRNHNGGHCASAFFSFSPCGWDRTSVFRHLGWHVVQYDAQFHALHLPCICQAPAGTGGQGWCHINTIGGPMWSRTTFVFLLPEEGQLRAPDHPQMVFSDQIPRLGGGDQIGYVFTSALITWGDHSGRIKTRWKHSELILIWWGAGPFKHCRPRGTCFRLVSRLHISGIFWLPEMCCSLRAPRVSVRTILLCKTRVCHSRVRLPAFQTEMEVAAGFFSTFSYRGKMTGRQS